MAPYRQPGALHRGDDDGTRVLRPPTRKAPPVPVPSWPAPIKKWWREIWVSAIAAEWDPLIDLQLVRRLGDLYAVDISGGELKAALLGQLMRIETELLLSPGSRKRAHVRLPPAEAGGLEAQAPAPPASSSAGARLKALRAAEAEAGG